MWAGEAGCLVSITYRSSSFDKVITQPDSAAATSNFNNYVLSFEVQPAAEAGKKIAKADYRLLISVATK